MNDGYRCDFDITPESNLVPWVELPEASEVTATVECGDIPVTPPPRVRTCEEDFFDET